MVISASTEKEYVTKWIQLLRHLYGFTARETEVAIEYSLTYRKLELIRDQLKGEGRKESYKPMDVLKSEQVLKKMTANLQMDFDTFRAYTKSLKDKGFFAGGTLAANFILAEDTATVTVTLGK
jgi:hypothetical protein